MGKKETKIARFVKKHKVIAIDTMAFIYHFEENQEYAPATLVLFDLLEKGEFQGITSVLTKLEILVKPKREGNEELVKTYSFLLNTFPNLEIKNVDGEVATSAAALRAEYNLRTPDAIQVASALSHQATSFITNDESLKKVKDLEVLLLKEVL